MNAYGVFVGVYLSGGGRVYVCGWDGESSLCCWVLVGSVLCFGFWDGYGVG